MIKNNLVSRCRKSIRRAIRLTAILTRKVIKIIISNPHVKLRFYEIISTAAIYFISNSLEAVNIWLLSCLIFSMVQEYVQNGIFKLKQLLYYLVFFFLLISALIFKDIRFLQVKAFLSIYLIAVWLLLSPFYIEYPPQYLAYKALLGDQNKQRMQHINFVNGLYALGLLVMNVWITFSFPIKIWIWFKTYVIPTMVLAYLLIQFHIWQQEY